MARNGLTVARSGFQFRFIAPRRMAAVIDSRQGPERQSLWGKDRAEWSPVRRNYRELNASEDR